MKNAKNSELVRAALMLLSEKYKSAGDDLDLQDTDFWELLDRVKEKRQSAIGLGLSYLKSTEPYERFFGISLLADICNPVEEDQEQEAEHIASELLKVVRDERSPLCLGAFANALSMTKSETVIPTLLELSRSKNEDVRWAAVTSFGTANEGEHQLEEVTSRLIELSRDTDQDVRDWATMWLGSRNDTPAVRHALHERLRDDFADARVEAICALAEKGDKSALPYLKEHLRGSATSPKIIEAAGLYGLPELYDELNDWGNFGFLQEWAQKRCSPNQEVRDSVDDEWLDEEWYLNVLHGVRRPLKLREGEHL